MTETIQERLNRLANAGRKREQPQEPAKQIDVFAHMREMPTKKQGGYLMALLDEVDIKLTGKVR